MSFQTSALILSWVAILLLALVVSGLVRQVHALTSGAAQRPGSVGLPPGAAAPALDLLAPDLAGPTLLLFLSPGCRTCADVLAEAAGWATADGAGAVRALYPGPVPAGVGEQRVPVHGEQADLFARYDAIATPFAVLVDRAGQVVRSAPVGSRAALRPLLAELDGSPVPRPEAAS